MDILLGIGNVVSKMKGDKHGIRQKYELPKQSHIKPMLNRILVSFDIKVDQMSSQTSVVLLSFRVNDKEDQIEPRE